MKTLVFACILAMGTACAVAQPAAKAWTRLIGGGNDDSCFAVAADNFGNGIIAGATRDSLAGGNAGLYDLFVAKYDSAGNQLWVRQRGTDQREFAYGVTADASGNIFVTGYTGGGLDGNSHIGASDGGKWDIFLTKFDASGNWQWTKQDGTGQADEGRAVCTDRSGNIYITGYVMGDFHGITRVGTEDVFISKYDSAGNRLWSVLFGSAEVDESYGIACDASGNVFVTGYCSGSIEGNTYLGNGDNFLVKYDTNGNRQWLRQWGTYNKDTGYSLACDASGNVYLSGYTTGSLYGPKPNGDRDAFLAKYDGAGNFLWGSQINSGGHDQGWGVATDVSGNIYLTGESSGPIDGSPYQGGLDIFLSKYDPTGNRMWTEQFGTAGDDLARGVAVATNGVVFLGGYTEGNLDGIANQGGNDAFIMKFSSSTVVPPSAPTATAATGVTSDAFTANWNSSTGATGYRLDVSTDSTFSTYTSGYQDLDVGNGLSQSVSGLSPGTSYYYRVRAYNGGGTSGNSGAISVMTAVGPPLAPAATAATGVTSNAFTANWNSSSGATGYRLDISTNGTFGNYLSGYQNLDVGDVLSVNIIGLSVDTTYYYRVRAYNTNGTSGNSATISVTTATTGSSPPAPTANVATSVTSGGFTANWSSSSGAMGYRLDVSTNNSFSSYVSGYQDLDVGNLTSRQVAGLIPATTYYYRVRAYNTYGASGNSVAISVTTTIPTCTPPILLNGSFEGTASPLGVGTNWIGYQRTPNPAITLWSIQTNLPPLGAGLQYQQIANTNSAGGGGVRQDITGCTIGATYIISGWMRGNSAFATCRVKCSPSTSTDWATAIDLNPPQAASTNTWATFAGTIVATGTSMTLWLDGQTIGTGLFKAECFDAVTVSCPAVPLPLRFESVAWSPPNQVQLTLTGEPGGNVTIFGSSNLVNWILLTNLINTNGTLQFTDTSVTGAAQRFYRATSP